MTVVRVVAETRSWQTRQRDESDSWDRGDTAGEVDNVFAEIVPEAGDNRYYSHDLIKEFEVEVKPGDTVYAVVVDYESGDTFGRSGGYAQVMDVFLTMPEAEGLYRECVSHMENYKQTRIYGGLEYGGQNYYVAWVGYFESVNDIEVWALTVRGGVTSDGVKLRTGR